MGEHHLMHKYNNQITDTLYAGFSDLTQRLLVLISLTWSGSCVAFPAFVFAEHLATVGASVLCDVESGHAKWNQSTGQAQTEAHACA